jgi:hypothetical protein
VGNGTEKGWEIARRRVRRRPYGARVFTHPRCGVTTVFHVAFVLVTIGLSLVVAIGFATLVTALLAVLVRPLWRSDGGTA